MAKVIKPFTTKLRRFKDGDTVSSSEDLTPHSFESLTGAGYIERLPVSSKPNSPTRTDPSQQPRPSVNGI